MLPAMFKIAMFNHDGVGPFHVMDEDFGASGRDWLIVERHGKALTISDGNIPSEPADMCSDAAAPFDLCENFSLSANHIQTSQSGVEADFMLSNFAPLGAAPEGQFSPSCGVVRLYLRDGQIALSAHGREMFDYAFEGEDGLVQTRSSTAEQRWHFSAQYRPWRGEQLPRRAQKSVRYF